MVFVSELIRQRGFSLIELMIVIAIVGVIAAVAIPSYTESVAKSKRAEAQTALAGLAVALERYRLAQTPAVYTGTTAAAIFSEFSPVGTSGTESSATYRLCIADVGDTASGTSCPDKTQANDYLLLAVPLNSQAGDKCGTFALADNGLRTVQGASVGVDQCWQ